MAMFGPPGSRHVFPQIGVYATFVLKLSLMYYTHNLSSINSPIFCV